MTTFADLLDVHLTHEPWLTSLRASMRAQGDACPPKTSETVIRSLDGCLWCRDNFRAWQND